MYLIAVINQRAILWRAGSVVHAVVVGVRTCSGSQVIFATQGGMLIPVGTEHLQQCVQLRIQLWMFWRNMMTTDT